MAANLTLYMCRDCGVTIPDGRGWFVWPGFPADGSPPLGVSPGGPRGRHDPISPDPMGGRDDLGQHAPDPVGLGARVLPAHAELGEEHAERLQLAVDGDQHDHGELLDEVDRVHRVLQATAGSRRGAELTGASGSRVCRAPAAVETNRAGRASLWPGRIVRYHRGES